MPVPGFSADQEILTHRENIYENRIVDAISKASSINKNGKLAIRQQLHAAYPFDGVLVGCFPAI